MRTFLIKVSPYVFQRPNRDNLWILLTVLIRHDKQAKTLSDGRLKALNWHKVRAQHVVNLFKHNTTMSSMDHGLPCWRWTPREIAMSCKYAVRFFRSELCLVTRLPFGGPMSALWEPYGFVFGYMIALWGPNGCIVKDYRIALGSSWSHCEWLTWLPCREAQGSYCEGLK